MDSSKVKPTQPPYWTILNPLLTDLAHFDYFMYDYELTVLPSLSPSVLLSHAGVGGGL